MATRDNLPVIRAARTGAAAAQFALGTQYFFGKNGLAQSEGAAFYWLERAARQGLEDACLMIGRHVPYAMLASMDRPYEAAPWYEQAFDAGIAGAGLVFSRLVLEHARKFGVSTRRKALDVLRMLSEKDNHDAQWMLAQYLRKRPRRPQNPGSCDEPVADLDEQALIKKAAEAGIEDAQYSHLEQVWLESDFDAYLATATSLAERLLQRHKKTLAQACSEPQQAAAITLEAREIDMIGKSAQLLQLQRTPPLTRVQRLLELAAIGGDTQARYELGLLHACIDASGQRTFPLYGIANYKKAVAWLMLAAHQRHAPAWHALSRVYARSEFAHRDLASSRRCLEHAAEMGLVEAQFDYAQISWRTRRDEKLNDVRAIYWWTKAAQQGQQAAQQALRQFAAHRTRGAWAYDILERVTTRGRKENPFLATRLELACAFGLSRPEALLLDVARADHAHCLEVDISVFHGRSRRRLVLIESNEQRTLLHHAVRLFNDVDCGYDGPEGNYRQRQYRLSILIQRSA